MKRKEKSGFTNDLLRMYFFFEITRVFNVGKLFRPKEKVRARNVQTLGRRDS